MHQPPSAFESIYLLKIILNVREFQEHVHPLDDFITSALSILKLELVLYRSFSSTYRIVSSIPAENKYSVSKPQYESKLLICPIKQLNMIDILKLCQQIRQDIHRFICSLKWMIPVHVDFLLHQKSQKFPVLFTHCFIVLKLYDQGISSQPVAVVSIDILAFFKAKELQRDFVCLISCNFSGISYISIYFSPQLC